MACGDNAEGRIGSNSLGKGSGGSAGDFTPGFVEAIVNFTPGDEAAVGEGEDNVCDEVAEVVASTERQDDFLVCAVHGDEAANAGHGASIKRRLD